MTRAGYIALIRFPHADLNEGKLRPALVLGKLPGNYGDWLIAMISSQTRQSVHDFDELIDESSEDFTISGLKAASVVRIGRLAVVDESLLEGAIGKIGTDRLMRIKSRLADWIRET